MIGRIAWWVAFLATTAGCIAEDIRERTVPGVCTDSGCYVYWWFIPLFALWVVLASFGASIWLNDRF